MKRVCVLTGASGVLGDAFCRAYASTYDIVAVYRSNPPAVPTQGQWYVDPLAPGLALEENAHPVFAVQADLTDSRDRGRVVELALARYGRIDLLVNAAVHSVWAPMVDSDALLEHAPDQFELNTIVPLRLATLIARAFWRGRDDENRRANRNVVNVSSIAGINIYPHLGQSVYSASKAALNYLGAHMGHEFWNFGVRINTLAPNSFPQIVATGRVVEAIAGLDGSTTSSRTLVLDAGGDTWM